MPLWPFRRDTSIDRAHEIYVALVEQARRPEFYGPGAVADTVDGRFEMILVHVALYIRRLNMAGESGRNLAQKLFDVLFSDMDRNLREMGIADLRVGKRVRTLATAYYGRAKAYDDGLDAGAEALADALSRNLMPEADVQTVRRFAEYLCREDAALASLSDSEIFDGLPRLGAPRALRT